MLVAPRSGSGTINAHGRPVWTAVSAGTSRELSQDMLMLFAGFSRVSWMTSQCSTSLSPGAPAAELVAATGRRACGVSERALHLGKRKALGAACCVLPDFAGCRATSISAECVRGFIPVFYGSQKSF